MVNQNKKVIVNTIITKQKNIVKKAKEELADLDKARADLVHFIGDQETILKSYEENINGKENK